MVDRQSARPEAIVITGPTASGKTAVAIEVAKRIQGEIISMDSRQVYREMNIGTAKPSPREQAVVPHHGLDLIAPDQRYSAGRFAEDARSWISEIGRRDHVPVLVGGTGFFLKALTDPMFAEPPLPDTRSNLRHVLQGKTSDDLLRWLDTLDPQAAERFRRHGGRQRMMRALEVVLLTGQPLSWWHEHSPPIHPPVPLMAFVLELPRDVLYERINRRVVEMVELGLAEEVRSLVRAGYEQNSPGMNATGYSEMLPFLRNETSLAEAIDAIQRATRRYARRQLTWFRHQLPPGAHLLDAQSAPGELAETIVGIWEREVESANRH